MTKALKTIGSIGSIAVNELEGNGAPAIGLGVVGDRYFDLTTGRRYDKRVVGNVNGVDNIFLPAQQNIAPISSIECCFKTSPTYTTDVGNSDIFGSELRMKIRSGNSRVNILVGNATASGWVIAGEPITPALANATWYKIRVDINNPLGTINAYLNGQLTYTKTWQSIETTGSGFRFGTIDMQPAGTNMCNCRYNNTLLPINEGSGAVLKDISGASLGALVDGAPTDFWTVGWVPADI